MKKTYLMAAGFASMLALAPVAQAATVAGNFNVTVTLTSRCTIATISDLAFGTYTAFQVGVQTATPVTATLSCTRGLLPAGITAAFDTVAAGSTAAPTATNAVGSGVLAGLLYNITATPGSVVAGSAAVAGPLGVGGSIGTSDSRPFTISGTMPGAQAGDASAAATQVRTLTITY
jgi:spore coat protein U-like protein